MGIALRLRLSAGPRPYTIGPVSGAHVNPAVTLGALIAKRIEPVAGRAYVVAHAARRSRRRRRGLRFRSANPTFDLAADGLGTNGWGEATTGVYGIGAAITVELVFTALLVMVVLAATARSSKPAVAGIPIGLVLVVAHTWSPSRSTAPRSTRPARSPRP